MKAAPWPLTGSDLLSQVRWIVWALEGGDRYGADVTTQAHDHGGATIAGLTWRCYSEDYLRLARGERCPLEDFRKLTLDDVVHVLLEVFALRPGLWKIRDPRLRLAVVDYAINAGADDAIPALQRAAGVHVDGIFGPDTERATNAGDPDRLRELVLDDRYQKAARVVVADRDQLANLVGWIRRFGQILRWRAAALAIAALALAGCTWRYPPPDMPFTPETPAPDPARIAALLDAPIAGAPGPSAPWLRLSSAFVTAGNGVRLSCFVPRSTPNLRAVRLALVDELGAAPGAPASTLETNSVEVLVEAVPCGRYLAVCDALASFGRVLIHQEQPFESRGACNAAGGNHS